MDPVTQAITLVFLVTTMGAIGLKVTVGELAVAFDHRGLMIRSLVVNVVVAPLLGLLLVTVVPMSRDAAIAILLLAAAPGGLNAIQFTSKSRGALGYAAVLLFVLSLVAILLSPFIAALLLHLRASLALPYGRIVGALLLTLLLPLTAGLAIHRWARRAAGLLSKPLSLCGTLAFVVVVVRLMGKRKEAIAALGSGELLAMVGLILALMVVAWLAGGPSRETRRVLATATSMRNAGLCLIVADHAFPDTGVLVAVVAFSGLMIFPNMLLTVYAMAKQRRSSGASQ